MTDGIFSHMPYDFRSEVSKSSLDIMFVASYGRRNPSPILETIQENYGEQLDDTKLTTLGLLILSTYSEKWDKLGAIYDLQYDPIHNYLDEWGDTQNTAEVSNASESVTDSLTKGTTVTKNSTRTDNLQDKIEYGKTTTRTDNLLRTDGSTETSSGTGSNTNSVYAFNAGQTGANADGSESASSSSDTISATSANTGKQDIDTSGSDIRKNTGTQSNNESIVNTGIDSRSISTTSDGGVNGERIRSGRHFGNIGNITTQKQIVEEISVWKWNYVNAILDDVKEFLTLPVYLNHAQFYEVND